MWLVAHGFVYPTDSSINVAIGQGGRVKPQGLSLEALDARGRWVVVAPDLGFPAGKNKTILIDLDRVARAGLEGARRLRLRTNLEIYWDSLAYAVAAERCPDEDRAARGEPRGPALPWLLGDEERPSRRARGADVRSDRQHRAALARSRRLLHALRRRARAARADWRIAT